MKKTITLFVLVLSFVTQTTAQCVPNPIFTMSPIPGIYPPNIPIPGIPFVGISDGQINSPYTETLTLVVLQDTTLDVGFLLPAPVVTAMNIAGISTVMTVNVNHVFYDVQGLPNNLTSICDIITCQYASGIIGCIAITGTPVQSGTFPLDVNMTVNIQIPAITDPILGTTLYAGGPIDMPTFSGQQYDLLINSTTGTINSAEIKNILFPNPTSSYSILQLGELSTVEIYNVLGKKIKIYKNKKEDITLDKSDFGSGMFYLTISSKNNTQIKKLIIK